MANNPNKALIIVNRFGKEINADISVFFMISLINQT